MVVRTMEGAKNSVDACGFLMVVTTEEISPDADVIQPQVKVDRELGQGDTEKLTSAKYTIQHNTS